MQSKIFPPFHPELNVALHNPPVTENIPAAPSRGSSMAVREEVGFDGVRNFMTAPASQPTVRPTDFSSMQNSRPFALGGMKSHAESPGLVQEAAKFQVQNTSREWAPAAAYPGQSRPGEPHREERVKNLADFELKGRDVGVASSGGSVVGGYAAGRDNVVTDLLEKTSQRTFDDFNEYNSPSAPGKTGKGTASVYSLHDQNRIESRDLSYKDAPGRFPGAFNHDMRNPSHPQEQLSRVDAFGNTYTSKSDYGMVHRQRVDEAPDRPGLRMNYADVYSSEWNGLERLENPRRVQHTVVQDIDVSMLTPWYKNPYTPPLGIVPFSGQNSTGLNAPMLEAPVMMRKPQAPNYNKQPAAVTK